MKKSLQKFQRRWEKESEMREGKLQSFVRLLSPGERHGLPRPAMEIN